MIEDRRELPPSPAIPVWDDNRYLAFIVETLQSIARAAHGRVWLFVLGDLITRIMEQDLASGGIVYLYEKQMGARFWLLVWFLTPKSARDRLTLSSLAPFLNREATLSGVFSGYESLPRTRFLDLAKPKRTDLGSFLHSISVLPANQIEERLRIFTAAFDDLAEPARTGPHGLDAENLKHLLKAIDKPSVHALEMWMEIPAGHRLFPWKVRYYQQIWRRNRQEVRDFFPDLEERIVADTLKTWLAARADSADEEAERLRAGRDQVLTTLATHLKPELVAVLLKELGPDDPYLRLVPDAVLSQALWAEQATPANFVAAFQHLLNYRSDWDPEWELLAGHRFFLALPPEMHARFFDAIQAANRATRHGIEQIIEKKYLHEPDAFKALLLGFGERAAMISRIVSVLRKGAVLAAEHLDTCNRWLQLIGVCREVDAELTARLIAPWINHRDAEFLMPALTGNTALLPFFVQAWSGSVRDEIGALRLCCLVHHRRRGLALDPASQTTVDRLMRENRAFDLLLGIK